MVIRLYFTFFILYFNGNKIRPEKENKEPGQKQMKSKK
jgi:hypothetical protein